MGESSELPWWRLLAPQAHYSWVVTKVPTLPLGLLSPLSRMDRVRFLYNCLVGVYVQVPIWSLPTLLTGDGGEHFLILSGRDECPSLILGLLWHSSVASRGWKSRFSTQPLLVGVGPVFSAWCLVGVQWSLSQSFVLLALLSWSMIEQAFIGTFLACVSWCFWVAGFSCTHYRINEILKNPKIKNPWNSQLCPSSSSIVPSQSATLSASFRVFLPMLAQGFSYTLMERYKEKYDYSVCQK